MNKDQAHGLRIFQPDPVSGRGPCSGDVVDARSQMNTIAASAEFALLPNRCGISESDHFAQFYLDDEGLLESLAPFVSSAVERGGAAIAVATRAHVEGLQSQWQARGFDAASACSQKRLMLLDAAEMLSQFMVDGAPDRARFMEVIGSLVADAVRRHGHIVVFGEMVALLWKDGLMDAVVQLEQLWNELAARHVFTLCCAYPLRECAAEGLTTPFDTVCASHRRVIPAENYVALAPNERLKLIALLQQKAYVLEQRLERDQAVAESLAQLAAIVESSDDAIVSKTLDGRIRSWNAGAQRIFGYSAEEVIGKSISVLIPPELHDEERQILQKLKRGERIDHFETTRVTKSGRRIDVSLTVSPVRDRTGAIVGASKTARDITERRRAEAAQHEEARVLGVLYRLGMTLAAGQLDPRRVVQGVTDAATELSGAVFGAFFDKVQNATNERRLLYALSGASREAFADLPMPQTAVGFALTFSGDGVLRSDDITQDPSYGHSSAYRGKSSQHPPVRSYLAVPVVCTSGEMLGALLLGHPQPGVFTERVERLIVGVTAQAAIAIDNARLHDAAQKELAHRKCVEKALNEANRRKDEFLALLAHELRNPLAPIRYAVAMNKKSRSREQQRRAVEIIERQAEHMSRLLDDLLDVSRITHGTLELKKAHLELAAVITAAVESAQPVLDAKRHTLTLDLPEEAMRLEADPVRLTQIFSNLLINAAKYTDAGGYIQVRAVRDEHEIVVTVRDNGIGISAEMMSRLFTLFSQARPAIDRSEGGLGVGLALVRGLVTLHEGTVHAHSEGGGCGSEFTVRLPIGVRPVEQPPIAHEGDNPPSGAALRLIVADDNQDAAETCAMLLELSGHQVHMARTSRHALELAETIRPHALLLDIGMPELNGYELAQRIRSAPWGRRMILIAITGWGQDQHKQRAREAGFDYHLVKPVQAAKLQSLLAAVAAEAHGVGVANELTAVTSIRCSERKSMHGKDTHSR